ncbi:MAG: magnesium/cobalt transporter CorA [Cytophagaceae bacterium]|jgi:magnesium transporter|nr:magnesium/cobalt transporter CorA [Cytophagaceae bacterium]
MKDEASNKAKVAISVIQYSQDFYKEHRIENPAELAQFFSNSDTISWINIEGTHCQLTNDFIIQQLCLHHIVRDELGHIESRPKLEDFEDHIYLVLNMLHFDKTRKGTQREQITFLLGKNYVITFQESGKDGDVFAPIRDRLSNAKGRHRRYQSDYLMMSMIDTVIDHYFDVLENIGEHIELLESHILVSPSTQKLHEIYRLKRELILLRKSVWPLREVLTKLEKENHELIHADSYAYLRVAYEHTIQVIETLESYRDIVAGLLDIYLSSMSNRMNSVMKVLTIISTIFMPLTFIAGIYGMNFKHMPELQWQYGYYGVLSVCFISALGMIYYFKKKNWL